MVDTELLSLDEAELLHPGSFSMDLIFSVTASLEAEVSLSGDDSLSSDFSLWTFLGNLFDLLVTLLPVSSLSLSAD